MCSIETSEELNQDRGSKWPRFRHVQDNSPYRGPLFQLITLKGENEEGYPLPRLCVEFFRRFNYVCSVWRNRDLQFWSVNKQFVVNLAETYIHDRVGGRHGNLECNVDELAGITLRCSCCIEYCEEETRLCEPCLLCEFASQLIAGLFRVERPRIVVHQLVKKILLVKCFHIGDLTHIALAVHIAGYAAGCYHTRDDPVESLRKKVLSSIWFCQEFRFAPEIKSIITREQFIIWAKGVNAGLLRPYWQQDSPPRNVWPFYPGPDIGAYLLRNHPHKLDAGFSKTIHISDRIPLFPRLKDLYPLPSESVILDLRRVNNDAWVEQQPGSVYVAFEIHEQTGWTWLESDDAFSESESEEGN